MKCRAIIYTEPERGLMQGDLHPCLKSIAGKPLLAHTLKNFQESPEIDEIIIVVDEDYLLYVSDGIVDRYAIDKARRIRPAAGNRMATVRSGLEALESDTDIVLIHDALRPVVSGDFLSRLINECLEHDAVVPGIIADVPVKRAEQGYILASLDKKRIFLAQSPQVFKYRLIIDAYRNAEKSDHLFADDAAVVEHYGSKIRVIKGEKHNLRAGCDQDFLLLKMILENRQDRGGGDV